MNKKIITDKEEAISTIRDKFFLVDVTDTLKHASDELKNDMDVVFEAVKKCGDALEYASEELRNNKAVVLKAIRQSGTALEFASKELSNDKEVVLEAVKENGYSLYFASEELKNNKEVVFAAVKQNNHALFYASEELSNSKEFIYEIKEFLEKGLNKGDYPHAYELLKSYEREDKLKNVLDNSGDSLKMKKAQKKI